MAENALAVPGDPTRKILKRQGITLPLSYLQKDTVAEVEDKLRLGIFATQNYVNEIIKNPGKIIDKDSIGSTLRILDEANTELAKEYGMNLTNDDIKIETKGINTVSEKDSLISK